ncbi:MAG: HAD family hydrolase [Holophagales bacterium]|nr:HAD family hydrolase [Holophagales bacterium]MBK9964170.1 HAD family hydrolase [Holophagales bacterium]
MVSSPGPGPVAERRAVFLDRDGVLVVDRDWLTRPDEVSVLPGVPGALLALASAGFVLVVVSNQAVVARGLVDENGIRAIHEHLDRELVRLGGVAPSTYYFCPHHPSATVPEYRTACDCRKPRPGLLLRAASELGIDLGRSYLVGDRMTDVAAGWRAGCRTILVLSGRHLAPPFETPDPPDPDLRPDWEAEDLPAATRIILGDAHPHHEPR